MSHPGVQDAVLTRAEEQGPAPEAWAPDDLARRLCLSLDIADRTIGLLGQSGYFDADAPEDSFGPDKPLAETAMLLHVAAGVVGRPEVSARVDALVRRLAPLARSDRTACAIALHPSICFQLAMPHILLSGLGLREARFDRVLALSAASLARDGREVPPHRALEGLWLRALWTGRPPGRTFEAAARRSLLNHPVDLVWGSRDDAYAQTHGVMYFTNFGYWRRPFPRPLARILDDSAGLLARSLLLEDFDLAAEVLMAWPLAGAPWPAAAAFGFRVLAELEDRVGYLPAGNGVPARYGRLAGSDRTRYALAASYHTAYLMGMLCALALRPGNAPPARPAGPRIAAALADDLLALIPEADTPWRHSLARLAPDERRALGPFLRDMALLARGRDNDFAALARLLGLAGRHGLADAPLCAQAAELLQRIAAGSAEAGA